MPVALNGLNIIKRVIIIVITAVTPGAKKRAFYDGHFNNPIAKEHTGHHPIRVLEKDSRCQKP